jgi:hypothetical protein
MASNVPYSSVLSTLSVSICRISSEFSGVPARELIGRLTYILVYRAMAKL